jgi:hypothetical protein
MRLEGLGQIKNLITSSRIESATFLACSVAPQPTTLTECLTKSMMERICNVPRSMWESKNVEIVE